MYKTRMNEIPELQEHFKEFNLVKVQFVCRHCEGFCNFEAVVDKLSTIPNTCPWGDNCNWTFEKMIE